MFYIFTFYYSAEYIHRVLFYTAFKKTKKKADEQSRKIACLFYAYLKKRFWFYRLQDKDLNDFWKVVYLNSEEPSIKLCEFDYTLRHFYYADASAPY